MKILLATPISQYKNYIAQDWFNFIRKLNTDNIELNYYFVDNSKDPEYHKKWIDQGFKIDYYRLANENNLRKIMTDCNNLIRDYFLASDYDYYFSLEQDVFPPFDIIQRLLRHQKDIVSALYFTGQAHGSYILIGQYEQIRNDGALAMNILTQRQSFNFINGKLRRATQNGIGCTLFKRCILEKFKFRYDPKFPEAHADSNLYTDLYLSKIPSYVDTAIICRHFNSDWANIKIS